MRIIKLNDLYFHENILSNLFFFAIYYFLPFHDIACCIGISI